MNTAVPSTGEPRGSKGIPVDLEHYSRRRLLECFRHRALPVLAISTAIDITGFATAAEAQELRFFTTLCCLISKTINSIPNFRHRIVADVLVEFATVSPSITVTLDDGNFSFADSVYTGHFLDDYAGLRLAIEAAKVNPNQDFRVGEGVDSLFFLTHLPWLSFTGIQHPYIPEYASIPAITTGRSFLQDGKEMLPIAVQANHALVDGVHVARFCEVLTHHCRQFGRTLESER